MAAAAEAALNFTSQNRGAESGCALSSNNGENKRKPEQELGGPTPHSDALRRPQRNTVERSEVSLSTFMQRRTRRHHKRTQMHTNTHAHMCKQMSTYKCKHAHKNTHIRSQRLLRG